MCSPTAMGVSIGSTGICGIPSSTASDMGVSAWEAGSDPDPCVREGAIFSEAATSKGK